MFTHSRFFLFAAALMVAAPMAAQQTSFDSTSRAFAPVAVSATAVQPAVAPTVGPMLQPSAVGSRALAPTTGSPMVAMPANGETSQNVALMLVGGAGLIVGAVIGGRSGTIVMLGSGILGLVGLFRYLQ
jgi:hypothetical protein